MRAFELRCLYISSSVYLIIPDSSLSCVWGCAADGKGFWTIKGYQMLFETPLNHPFRRPDYAALRRGSTARFCPTITTLSRTAGPGD
jgi:hypothetical protein